MRSFKGSIWKAKGFLRLVLGPFKDFMKGSFYPGCLGLKVFDSSLAPGPHVDFKRTPARPRDSDCGVWLKVQDLGLSLWVPNLRRV